MTPYYVDGRVTIYHGRAEEILPSLAGPVVITDPPYGWKAYSSDREAATEVLRTSLERRTAAVFGYPELLVKWCVDLGRVPDEWVTWWPTTQKARGVGNGLPRESESIAIFGPVHGRRILRPRKQDKWAVAVALSRGLDPDWCRDGDVWRTPAEGVANNGAARLHPNQKPVSLMERLVLLCSDEGELILDPYTGSGSTLLAARNLGRPAIGIEIEERFCEVAAQRLAATLDLGGAA